jgi:hypothetical protein
MCFGRLARKLERVPGVVGDRTKSETIRRRRARCCAEVCSGPAPLSLIIMEIGVDIRIHIMS